MLFGKALKNRGGENLKADRLSQDLVKACGVRANKSDWKKKLERF